MAKAAPLTLAYTRDALASLEAIPKKPRRQIINRINALTQNPHPKSSKPLKGVPDVFRERAGDYRILYKVKRPTLTVLDIGHRKDVYRDL